MSPPRSCRYRRTETKRDSTSADMLRRLDELIAEGNRLRSWMNFRKACVGQGWEFEIIDWINNANALTESKSTAGIRLRTPTNTNVHADLDLFRMMIAHRLHVLNGARAQVRNRPVEIEVPR